MTLVRQAFRDQARACAALGSPLMERLMSGLADRLEPGDPVADRVLGWPGDPSSKADSLPLRLAGGLHALTLTGQAPALAAAYASGEDPTDTALATIRAHPDFLLDWLKSPPQTNEVRRSAPLIAAAHWLTHRFRLPLILSELGASAGLNLLWDHYALQIGDQTFGPDDPALTLTPDWTGPLPPPSPPTILDRRGVDLNPLDPVTDACASWPISGPTSPTASPAPAPRSIWPPGGARPSTGAMRRPGLKPGWPPRQTKRCRSSSTPSPGSISRPPRKPAR